MKWFVVVILALFSFPGNIMGQDTIVVGNEALNKIFEINDPLFFDVQPYRKNNYINVEGYFSLYPQSLLKSKNDFFIRTDGTGRIFKALRRSGDSLFLQRIDSTHFYGYNGEAYDFVYKDTIMSLGGLGYWRKNGHLRFYSAKNREWDVIPLNTEIPVTKECIYYDTTKQELYLLTTPYLYPATREYFKEQLIYKLNLENRNITLLGSLNKEQAINYPVGLQYISLQLTSLNAQLVIFQGSKIFLYDFINNEIYGLKNQAIENRIFSSSTGSYLNIIFERNGKLFFSKSNDPKYQLDSIPIKITDFKKLNQKLYIPKSNKLAYLYWIGGLLFLSIGAFVFSKKYFRKPSNINEGYPLYDGTEIKFKEIELDLIEKIYNRTLEGKSYSVEDINAALGLSKKSLEIQKKIRTETINRINHRFKIIFNTEDELIERIRLEEDRRFYKYIISEENGKKALGI